MGISIIPTSKAEYLAKKVLLRAKGLKIIFPDLSRDRRRYFPDGEIYMGIAKANKFKNERVVVLHSGAPNPNEGLMELELILQILRDNDVRPEVFFSYFPYGMQDEVFKKGETNAAENLIEKLVNYYRVKKIYIIDPHFGGRKWVKKYPIITPSAVPLLIHKAEKDLGLPSPILGDKTWKSENILFLSPDVGGKRRTGIPGARKERLNSFSVEMFSRKLNLKGKLVWVIDDMIKTGGTLLKFQEIIKKAGAKKNIALVTHGVIPAGISKVKNKYSKLYLTNTIEHRMKRDQLRRETKKSFGDRKRSDIDITDLILRTIDKR